MSNSQVASRIVHFLIGDLSVQVHGLSRVLGSLSLSLLVFPISCLASLWQLMKQRRMVVGIARNGHANASHFIHDYEPFNRRHLAGEFGDARVVFVVDRVPLGPKLWDEVRAGSMLEVPVFPRLYRCMPANRYVTRVYLTVSTNTTDTRRGFALPDAGSPCRGAPPPVALAEIGLGDLPTKPFALMQVHRPEMFWSLQSLANRKDKDALFSSSQTQDVSTYALAQSSLGRTNYPIVDLWNTVGNPVNLLRSQSDCISSRNDELQTWLFANCELFLSGASGAWWIAFALGKPTLATDCYSLCFEVPMTMFLPKLIWDRDRRCLVPLSDMGSNLHYQVVNRIPGRFEVIRNSADEITEAVLELRSIVRGDCEVDNDLQARVVRCANKSLGSGKAAKPMPILGQRFLRRHLELLA